MQYFDVFRFVAGKADRINHIVVTAFHPLHTKTQLFIIQQRAYQSFKVTPEFDSVYTIVIRWVNLRQNVNMNIDPNHQTTCTMRDEEISIHTVVITHEAGRVTNLDTFFQQI